MSSCLSIGRHDYDLNSLVVRGSIPDNPTSSILKTKSHSLAIPLGAVTLLFVITLGRAAVSLDTWAERYVGNMVRDVADGGGLFVAVGDAFYDSPDGQCWTRRALDTASIHGLSGGVGRASRRGKG